MNRSLIITTLVAATLAHGAPVSAQLSINFLDAEPKNGLSNWSFLRNSITTNPDAIKRMRTLPLNQALMSDPVIGLQLNERRGRAVMEEIIKCALAPARQLTYTEAAGTTSVWQGELGLCQHPETEVGDWGATAPTPLCQELITACVMARVNALGMAVPLALRGAPVEVFPPRPVVATERTWRERAGSEDPAEGTLLESFGGPICQVGHECRWAPAYVGKCTSGTVSLAIQAPDRCLTTPIRVCAGIHGCYGPGSPVGYPSTVPYSRFWRGQSGACTGSTLSFPCPTDAAYGGFYSVMTRPSSPVGYPAPIRPVSPTVIKLGGAGSYPATGAEVFAYVEGAFYGNLFEPEELRVACKANEAAPTQLVCSSAGGPFVPVVPPCSVSSVGGCPPQVPPTMPYRNVYACYAVTPGGDEAEAVAYMNDRICAQHTPGGEPCFPHPPRRCSARCTPRSEGGIFEECQGAPDTSGAVPRYRAITTYLNGPCDLIGGSELCSKVRGQLLDGPYGNSASNGNGGNGNVNGGGPGPAGREPRGPRGCGGCSSGEGGEGAEGAPVVIAVAVLLAMSGLGKRY